jgi:hypothetical protein
MSKALNIVTSGGPIIVGSPPYQNQREGASLLQTSHPAPKDVDGGEHSDGRLDDGRMKCRFCGRGFAPERHETHQSICSKLRQARAGQEPVKVYDSAVSRWR